MTLQMADADANSLLDQWETLVGASAILKVRTGGLPANCAAPDSGTVLSTVNLPADWLLAAVARVKAKSGTWEDAAADASGTPGHFRLYDSGGAVCRLQGDVTITGGGGAMEVDSMSWTAGQTYTIVTFDLSL